MLFSFGFDNQITIWNLMNKGGIVSSKFVKFDIIDCIWIKNNLSQNKYQLISCGEDNIHYLDLDPFKGKINIKPFNLKKVKRKFLKLFQLVNLQYLLCGTFTGDVLLLDLEFEKFLLKEVHAYTDISKAKHHMTNTYPVISDTPRVTHIIDLPITHQLFSKGKLLNF